MRTKDSKIWFWSDPHFDHANIIDYCSRPFSSKDEMNEALISNYNSVVGEDDIVWCLGDFALTNIESIKRFRFMLNGHLLLVKGNHDILTNKDYLDAGFEWVYDRPLIFQSTFVLSHYPLEWVEAPMFNIFGHVHINKAFKTFSKTGCCTCVERHDYKPISLKTIKAEYEKLNDNSQRQRHKQKEAVVRPRKKNE